MAEKNVIDNLDSEKYKYGFTSNVQTEAFPPGLDENVVRRISAIKGEPDWLLDFRLKAYRHWKTLKHPQWGHLKFDIPDFQAISYFAQPKNKAKYESLDEVDPEIVETFNKLGIPLEEQKVLSGVAVDAVFDSVSVHTQFREQLKEKGIIFCSFSDAAKEHPELVKQ